MAATLVMIITLFIISSLFILNFLANLSLISIQEKVDLSVYFKLNVSEQSIKQIQTQVEQLPEVKSVAYIPPVEAREKFKELHKDEPLLIESVEQFEDDENPFPASFAIRVYDLEDYGSIINIFEDDKFGPFVKKITDKRDIVNRLKSITDGIRKFGIGLTAVFSFITVVVMYNTIRLTIYSRRDDIEVMRLVGASNSFIRGPFVVEGILYGVLGAVLTFAVLFPVLITYGPRISNFLELESTTSLPGPNVWVLFGLLVLLGSLLGIISSYIAIRRYLKI